MGSQPSVVDELYRHSLPRLGAYAYLLTGSHAEAEELVQAAIVKVCARPRRLTNLPQTEAYVRAAIRTLHIDGLRRQARWHRAAPTLAWPDAVAGPAEHVTQADAVALAMATLAPRVRTVVAMYYWEDLPIADIAGAMGISEGTVKGYLRDGREALAPLLGDDDGSERSEVTEVRS
ncbi:RNA polymerase sigma factor [Demequina sp.]|uniref:RNA polymerase sigma factor n=1 Tax=Demequina sp. TaxID=2050685 RepID=UPI003D0B47C3